MTIRVTISSEAERLLMRWSAQTGMDAEAIAARLLERSLCRVTDLASISGEIAARFAESGLSEDELSAILEHEKHEMRQERRKAS